MKFSELYDIIPTCEKARPESGSRHHVFYKKCCLKTVKELSMGYSLPTDFFSFLADVAQLVEQRIRNARAGGSIPLIGLFSPQTEVGKITATDLPSQN